MEGAGVGRASMVSLCLTTKGTNTEGLLENSTTVTNLTYSEYFCFGGIAKLQIFSHDCNVILPVSEKLNFYTSFLVVGLVKLFTYFNIRIIV